MNHFCTFYVIRTDIWDNFYFDSVFGYSCPPKVMQQHNQTTWRVCGTQQRSQNYISMTGLIYTVFYLNAVRYNMKCNTQLKLCMTTLCLQDSLHSFGHGPDVLVNVLLWYLVQASWIVEMSCGIDEGRCGQALISLLSSCQTGLMGLRSGEFGGWGKRATSLLVNHVFANLAVWLGALSSWKTTPGLSSSIWS